MNDDYESMFYLPLGSIAAIVLGMILVPVREMTTASNFTFAFMALTIVVAEYGGRWAAASTAFISALSLDFFLTRPYLSLEIAGKHDIIAFAGLLACGLIAAALGSQRGARNAALRAVRAQLELLRVAAAGFGDDAPIGERLAEVLHEARKTLPLAGAVVRDRRGEVVATTDPDHAKRPVPASILQPDTLLPAGVDLHALPPRGLALPAEGGRLLLVTGNRQMGSLDIWGNETSASLAARRTLADLGRLMGAMLHSAAAVLLVLLIAGTAWTIADDEVTTAAPATSAEASPAATAAAEDAAPGTTGQEPPRAKKPEPFAFADFTWLTGNPRTKVSPIDTPVFTGEVRVDVAYHYSFSHPQDDTIVGSSEVFRSGEFQVTQLGVGGDFHYDNVRARLMTQFGMYSQTTPRNDSSPARGQWQLDNAYRYVSEAYGGYHIDRLNGINIDAGIFMSYVGLYSYYQFDNWAYQPSYVSSNTPWFFNGMRVQIFVSDKLKIEPWLVNGWQSYGKFNNAPGLGMQILWRPNGSTSFLTNLYWGTDALGNQDRNRVHTDTSIQYKYFDHPDRTLDKAAFTFTFDLGCEYGGGVSCHGGDAATPSQYFIGFMAYNRLWFDKDRFAVTIGGGAINNPGRYLVLLPPVNGATAASGTPYFTENPGDQYRAWDASLTFDYMPSQFVTFRLEGNHRAANVPYFAGPEGVTPPTGNVDPPGSVVPGFTPDLVRTESRMTGALLVKF